MDSEVSASVMDSVVSASVMNSEISAAVMDSEVSVSVIDSEVSASVMDSEISASVMDSEVSASVMDSEISASVMNSEISASVMDSEVSAAGMDIDVYLERIGYSGPRDPTVDTLFRLQAAHQLKVPFENADIFEGRKKVLELPTLFSKIVTEHRGGWCCELNGLFCWLLRQLGFTVKMVSAPSFRPTTNEWLSPFAHMGLLVYIDDTCYLTDVGWGGPIAHFQPIEVKDGIVSRQINGTYSLERDGDFWVLKKKDKSIKGHHREEQNKDIDTVEESWTIIHRFDTEGKQLEEFQERCDQYQFDQNSTIMACIPVVIIKKENGSCADMLVGRRYTHIKFQDGVDVRTNQLNLDDQEIKELLKEKFGMNLKKRMLFMEKPAIGLERYFH